MPYCSATVQYRWHSRDCPEGMDGLLWRLRKSLPGLGHGSVETGLEAEIHVHDGARACLPPRCETAYHRDGSRTKQLPSTNCGHKPPHSSKIFEASQLIRPVSSRQCPRSFFVTSAGTIKPLLAKFTPRKHITTSELRQHGPNHQSLRAQRTDPGPKERRCRRHHTPVIQLPTSVCQRQAHIRHLATSDHPT